MVLSQKRDVIVLLSSINAAAAAAAAREGALGGPEEA